MALQIMKAEVDLAPAFNALVTVVFVAMFGCMAVKYEEVGGLTLHGRPVYKYY